MRSVLAPSTGKDALSRRRFLSLLATITASGTLAACAGGSTSRTTSSVTQQTTPGTVPAQRAASSGAKITVHWLLRSDMGPLIDKWEKNTAAGFEKLHPDITVQPISVPWAQYNTKLLTLFAANEIPEVFATFAAGFGTFLANGTLAPLNPYLQRAKVDISKQFAAETLSEVTRNGNIVALPMGHFGTVLFYNATLLQEAGAALPPMDWSNASWTIDAMLTSAHKATRQSSDPSKRQWGLIFDAQQLGVMSWLWGVDPFNNKGGPTYTEAYQTGILTESYLDNPPFVTAMQWIADLALKHKVAPLPSDVNALKQGIGDAFLTGRIGMFLNGQWETQSLAHLKPSWQWGIGALPYGPGKADTSPLYNDSFMLGKGSKAINQGFTFLQYLTFDTPSEEYALSTGFFPARISLYDKAAIAIAAIPGATQTQEQIRQVLTGGYPTGFVTPGKTLDNYNEFNTAWGQGTSPIWSGQAQAGPTLQVVNQKFKALIASQQKGN